VRIEIIHPWVNGDRLDRVYRRLASTFSYSYRTRRWIDDRRSTIDDRYDTITWLVAAFRCSKPCNDRGRGRARCCCTLHVRAHTRAYARPLYYRYNFRCPALPPHRPFPLYASRRGPAPLGVRCRSTRLHRGKARAEEFSTPSLPAIRISAARSRRIVTRESLSRVSRDARRAAERYRPSRADFAASPPPPPPPNADSSRIPRWINERGEGRL